MKLSRFGAAVAAASVFALTLVAFGQAGQQAGGGPAPSQGQGAGAAPEAQQVAPGARGGGGRGGAGGGRGGGRGGAAAAPAAPAPRWPDGTIRLGALPGQTGLWYGDFGGGRGGEIPFQPWARGVYDFRRENELEPHARCKPSGVVRQFQTPYGVDIVDMPETKVIYIMDVGGPHSFRTIHMDGRSHPKDPFPSAYGHSIGRWEGDTLVVDTVGFNENFWLDRAGLPHTKTMHVIERFTRVNMNTMRYEYTVDDPSAYTAPWTKVANMSFRSGDELFEYICQDNNLGSELMVGAGTAIDRRSEITP